MSRRRNWGLYPLEIASNVEVQLLGYSPNTDTKVVRFYSNHHVTPPPRRMDTFSVDDLKEAGFVNLRYKGVKDPRTLKFSIEEDPKRMVHQSVPVFDSINSPTKEHPVIAYSIGAGFEATWGAIRFPLRSEIELWRFMKFFEYPLPIDQKPNENT